LSHKFEKKTEEDPHSNIQTELKEPFSKLKLAIIGALFTLSNFTLFSGSRGNYLSGPLLTLLQQMTVPFTIALCMIFMKRRFSPLHFVGALIIIAGILFTIWPSLVSKEKESNNHWWAALLVVLSSLFQSTAIVYMERNLKYNKMPFLSSWAWINVFELILTIPLVVMIPPIQGISFQDIPANVEHGCQCFFANYNPETNGDCGRAAPWFVLFIAVLVANKLLMTYMIKKGSSALVMVSLTCALPLSNLAFASPHLVGSCSAVSLDWHDFVGLAIVVCGLLVYRYTMFVPLFCRGRTEDQQHYSLLRDNNK